MHRTRLVAFSLATGLVMFLAGVAGAGSSANSAINWQVLSGGGAPAASENITLTGSLGQTAIGPSSGGRVNLEAGYWSGVKIISGNGPIYLPLILRSN